MHSVKQFNTVEVEVMDKSGFDLSHQNIFSTTPGTLTPCLCEFMYPSDTFTVSTRYSVTLPPLATNFKGQVNAKVELFFVPCRILWAGWKDFIMRNSNRPLPIGVRESDIPTTIPQTYIDPDPLTGEYVGSLADYLGVKTNITSATAFALNLLPFAAYHKIWETYYRSHLTKPFFNEGYGTGQSGSTTDLVNMPYKESTFALPANAKGNNGFKLNQLYQRCWLKDRYTTATPTPQFGDAATIKVESYETPEGGYEGSFSIASLRAANALQKFLERSNLGQGASAYYDFIKVHYGITPSDACLRGPVFIGSVTTPVYINSVATTNNNISQMSDEEGYTSSYSYNGSRNPFSFTAGAQFGQALCNGSDKLCKDFTATEFGYLMGIFSLVPTANYGTGTRKYLRQKFATDLLYPEFAGIGDQPIFNYELSNSTSNPYGVFGYNRYGSEAMFHEDEVHGLFKDGKTLENFVNQRTFNGNVTVNTDFVTISRYSMDNVLAYNPDDETLGDSLLVMVDMFWNISALRRLPESPLPHL